MMTHLVLIPGSCTQGKSLIRDRRAPHLIYQSASFVFESAEDAVGLFNIERAGHVYSRHQIQPMPYSKSALRSWTKELAP